MQDPQVMYYNSTWFPSFDKLWGHSKQNPNKYIQLKILKSLKTASTLLTLFMQYSPLTHPLFSNSSKSQTTRKDKK